MRPNLKIAGIVSVIAVLMIALIFWYSNRAPKALPTDAETTSAQNEQVAPEQINRSPSSPSTVEPQTSLPSNEEPQGIPTVSSNNPGSNWEQKVDDVLRGDSEPAVKAKELLAVFPSLPEEGQIEAVKHLSNLTPNENYPQLGQYLTNAATPPEVLDELMADVFNRPNSIKLPALLEIARNPQHPKASEARETLRFFLDKDYRDDWNLWEQKLAEWLKNNPD